MFQFSRALFSCGAALLAAVPVSAQLGNGGRMEELWSNNCANCHGAKGEGGGAGTQTLLTREQFGQEFDKPYFDAIKNGVPDMGMAAFGATFSDKEIWGMVVHIRELQGRALRKAGGSPKAKDGVYSSTHAQYRLERVVTDGLRIPWALDFLPDGRMLITERPGTLRVHSTGKRGGELSGPVAGLPKVLHMGQGGLMDVALHPDFATNGWIYLGYADAREGAGGGGRGAPNMTRIVRGRLKDVDGKPTWTDNQDIWKAEDKHYGPWGLHFGNRIVFEKAPQGAKSSHYVYWCIGERGQAAHAQDLSRPNGKIHRLFDDGQMPDDNPFVNNPNAVKSIWSYGHRNPQGLVFDLDGKLWDTEHGPRGGDELNLIQKGGNYGWPIVAFSINYSGEALETPWTADGKAPDGAMIIQPVFRWMPSIAACGLDVVKGDAFPAWKGDLVAGGLAGAVVDRIRIKDGKFVEREELIQGIGRVRDVVTAPDGTIYVALNDPDHIIRLVPAAASANGDSSAPSRSQ